MSVAARREKEKLERRKSILIAARDLFFEKGYQTTVEEIAEAAEVSKGTVYLYFGSKDELYVTVVLESFDIVEDLLEEIMSSEADIVDKGTSMFMGFVEHCMKNREYFRVTQYFLSENIRKNLPPEMIETVSGHTAKLLGYVAQLVKDGIDAGIIRDEVDPYIFALIAWRTATGILDLAIVGDSVAEQVGPYNELFEQSVKLLIRGAMKETARGGS